MRTWGEIPPPCTDPHAPPQQVAESEGNRSTGRAGTEDAEQVMDQIGNSVACLRAEQGEKEPLPREAEIERTRQLLLLHAEDDGFLTGSFRHMQQPSCAQGILKIDLEGLIRIVARHIQKKDILACHGRRQHGSLIQPQDVPAKETNESRRRKPKEKSEAHRAVPSGVSAAIPEAGMACPPSHRARKRRGRRAAWPFPTRPVPARSPAPRRCAPPVFHTGRARPFPVPSCRN